MSGEPAESPPADSDAPFVSVIVPVWNDADRLAICLRALVDQDYPAARYEIIVVDNGSATSPAPLVSQFPGVRLLTEPLPAADRARNTGLREAKGDVIAFTDSDCIPQSDWIRLGVENLRRWNPPGLVGGRIDVTPNGSSPSSLAELYDMVLGFPQERNIRRSHYGATANLFTCREVIDAVGPFREADGGDADWGPRVHRAGRPVAYADDVRVRHPARPTVSALIAQTRRGAGMLVGWRRGRPLLLVRDLFKDFFIPPDLAAKILTSPRLIGVWSRVRVLLLFMALRQVRFWEKLRVLMGGAPLR